MTLNASQAALVSNVNINIDTTKVGNQIYFKSSFSGVAAAEMPLLASINLSRGRNRRYRLDRVSEHNGTGANWDGSLPIHTYAQEVAYVNRVKADFATAWVVSKAANANSRQAAKNAAQAAYNAAQAAKAKAAATPPVYLSFFSANGG